MKTSVTLATDDVTDDVSALAADESSVHSARKSSHHGHFLSSVVIFVRIVLLFF